MLETAGDINIIVTVRSDLMMMVMMMVMMSLVRRHQLSLNSLDIEHDWKLKVVLCVLCELVLDLLD